MSDYPEHEKLKKVSDQSQVCGEFLDWLQGKYVLAKYVETGTWAGEPVHDLRHANVPVQDLLAEFFGIDQDKIEAEKRAMIEACRSLA